MYEWLIDVIIFSTMCIKAQDKLLQMPKTLSLQQCLTVCRHYGSQSLHIQQIHPGSDRHIEFLHKCHPKSKKSGQNKPQSKGRRQHPQNQSQSLQQKATKSQKKCYGCGHNLHKDHARNCPAWSSTCRKCNKPNHCEVVCGQVPNRRPNRRRQSGEQSMVSEVRNSTSTNAQTVPKQVFDIVNMANSVDNLSHCYKRQLELDTLTMTSSTQFFSNIQINGIPVKGKQDTGAEISIMPLNIFDQLNSKLKGELKLCPCNDIQVIGYSKQSVKIVRKVTVTCSHADTTKHVFYITDLTDSKILLGLTFCKAFNLVKILCDGDCVCKKMMVDMLNEFPTGLDIPKPKQMDPHQVYLPPVDINTKLRSNYKAHIMELFPELFDGIGTIKDAIVKLNVDQSVILVIQPPRKIPQAMVEPLKHEIERMMNLGVIRKCLELKLTS